MSRGRRKKKRGPSAEERARMRDEASKQFTKLYGRGQPKKKGKIDAPVEDHIEPYDGHGS